MVVAVARSVLDTDASFKPPERCRVTDATGVACKVPALLLPTPRTPSLLLVAMPRGVLDGAGGGLDFKEELDGDAVCTSRFRRSASLGPADCARRPARFCAEEAVSCNRDAFVPDRPPDGDTDRPARCSVELERRVPPRAPAPLCGDMLRSVELAASRRPALSPPTPPLLMLPRSLWRPDRLLGDGNADPAVPAAAHDTASGRPPAEDVANRPGLLPSGA